MELITVFIGGSIGAGLRYLVYLIASSFGMPFSGTFAVNIIGCLLLGILMNLEFENEKLIHKHSKLFLTTGIISSFTTFSTFSYETLAMIENGQIALGLVYIFLSLFIGMLAILSGFLIAEKILSKKFKVEKGEEICMD